MRLSIRTRRIIIRDVRNLQHFYVLINGSPTRNRAAYQPGGRRKFGQHRMSERGLYWRPEQTEGNSNLRDEDIHNGFFLYNL